MSVKSKGLTVPDKNAADGANRGIRKYIRHNWQLWIMLFPAMLYILIFCYVPMYGIQLAFREYSFTAGITGGKFVGMKYFRQYFESPMFWTTLKNTFVISATSILVGFPVPIILAMVINQIRSPKWKRTVQTTVYIPYFISVVVLVSMLNIMFANDSGVIANFLKACISFPGIRTYWGRNPVLSLCMCCPASGRPWDGTVLSLLRPFPLWIRSCTTHARLTAPTGGRQ